MGFPLSSLLVYTTLLLSVQSLFDVSWQVGIEVFSLGKNFFLSFLKLSDLFVTLINCAFCDKNTGDFISIIFECSVAYVCVHRKCFYSDTYWMPLIILILTRSLVNLQQTACSNLKPFRVNYNQGLQGSVTHVSNHYHHNLTAVGNQSWYWCVSLYRINYSWGALDPFSYHAVNIVLHCLVSIMSLRVFYVVFGSRAPRAAVLAAILFATHPIHTEAVSWKWGRER